MKRAFLLSTFFILVTAPLIAQETGPTLEEEYPLTIAIVGTSNYSDVNILIRNLKRSAQIESLSASTSKRDLSEFTGRYRGSQEALIDEIKGLAQDRFSVELPKQKNKQGKALYITLRKITETSP